MALNLKVSEETAGSAFADASTFRGVESGASVRYSGAQVKAAVQQNFTTSMFAANVVDIDGTLAANSDTRLATQKAVKTYADTKQASLGFTAENVANKDTDGTLSANSDTKYPSQKAVKTYADQLIASADAMVFKGVIDASANPNYPAADRGNTYRISVGGKIGGASGTNVEVGDLLLCLTDGTIAGTQAAVGASWTIAQTNLDGAVIGPASVTDNTIALFSGTTGKLLKAATLGATLAFSGVALQTAAATGDVTWSANSFATTIGATKVTSAMLNADVYSTAHSWGGTQTFAAPVLGTPTSGTLTNCTLPVGGVTGLGTGIATALAVNVGTAGAPVINGGALGSPSSAGTIPAFTLGGTIAGGGNQLNNIIIGTTTPLAGSFTTVTASSIIKAGDGAVNTPAYSFGSDTSSGIYHGSGTINFSKGGGDIMLFGTGGVVVKQLYFDTTNQDVILTRISAGVIQHGAADAASPVAQTTKVQGVVAGTSNTAGADFTIKGSAGTGTGAGGSIIFQVAPAGSTGTSQNAYATALTIDSTKLVTFAGNVVVTNSNLSTPIGIFFESSSNVGIGKVTAVNMLGLGARIQSVTDFAIDNSARFRIVTSGAISWSDNANAGSGTLDVFLTRSGAATLQQGAANAASPVAQIYQAQGSRSGTDSDVGGANMTVRSGNGTGIGAISSLILQSPIVVASGTGAQTQTTGLTIKAGTAVLTSYAVSGLPAASVAGAGATAFVTDASTTLILGLGGTVTGGGANKVPVYSDGTNWVYG